MISHIEDVVIDEGDIRKLLEDQLTQILALQQNPAMPAIPGTPGTELFQESQNGMNMPSIGSFLKINNGNVVVIGIGLILSSQIGGMVSRWLPSVSQYATIIAGLAIMYIAKSKPIIRDLGVGVLLGGLASTFSGLGNSLGGILGGNGMAEQNTMMETRETYGGTDGMYPENPDRKVFM